MLSLFTKRSLELRAPDVFKVGDVFEEITSESGLRVLRPGTMGYSTLLANRKLQIPKEITDIESELRQVSSDLHRAIGGTIARDRRLNEADVLQGLEVSIVLDGSPTQKMLTQTNGKAVFHPEHLQAAQKIAGSTISAQVLINLNLN